MIDFAQARETMVESQLRTAGITDRGLLAAMASLPREIFVAPESRSLAYMDGDVPVAPAAGQGGRYLMQPMTLARLIQAADIVAADRVLVIGCATGYSAAVIAALCSFVVGLESDEDLARRAAVNLGELGIANAEIVAGPLADGAPAHGPYDLIFFDGSVPEMPATLAAQLNEGGRAAAVISMGNQGVAHLFTKTGEELAGLPQFAAGARPLPGFAREASFSF